MADAPNRTPGPSARDLTVRGLAGQLGGLFTRYGIVFIFLALLAVVGGIDPGFLSGNNILNILQQWAPVGLMAMAGTFVIIAGGFDLSVGGVFALSGVIAAGVSQDVSVALAYPAVIGIGAGFGLMNGLLITRFNVNPFIGTIATGQMARGLALIYTGAAPLIVTAHGFDALGGYEIGSVSISTIILIAGFIIGGLVLSRSVYGRLVYAVGGNQDAARLSGVAVDRIVISTYVVSGITAGIAGFMFASRLGLGEADVGVAIEFDVIIAIVLGGTAIGGGVGAMWRTALGVAFLAVMQNGFDALDISSFYQILIKGGILAIAVAWDEWIRRTKAFARAELA